MLARAVKRHTAPMGDSSTPKRPRLLRASRSPPPEEIHPPIYLPQDQLSIREQAERYRLVTVLFPIDALTPNWERGRNRPVAVSQVRRLQGVFRRELDRTNPSNALRVACRREQVERMIAELERRGETRTDWKERTLGAWPSFMDWGRVNDQPVELMAGNHRVEALKEYLKEKKADRPSERWWLCDVYDQDTLPLEISIQLRANREELGLPDSHAQVWNELHLLDQNDPGWHRAPDDQATTRRKQGIAKPMEAQLTRKLGFQGQTSFPVRRLGILWRNERWRDMITEWCQFPLGQATFNISTWEWMSSCRVDDFWFSIFQQALHTLRTFREQHRVEIQASDWKRIAQLPQPRQGKDLQDLFLPGLQEDHEADVGRLRVRDFLADLDDTRYNEVYHTIFSNPSLQFPDVHTLFKQSKQLGRVTKAIMTHVGQWLNPDAFRASNRAEEKPPLWKDLLPAVRKRYPRDTDHHCLELQLQVLTFVQKHLTDFTQAAAGPFLDVYPHNGAEHYAERFGHPAWHNLLELVYDFCGPCFEHEALTRFNDQAPSSLCNAATSTIAQNMCQALQGIPEIVRNPALQGKQAMKDLELAIRPVVLRWAVQRCERMVREGEDGDVVKEQLDQYRRLLGADEPALENTAMTITATKTVAASEEGHAAEGRSRQSLDEDTPPAPDVNGSPPPTVETNRIKPRLVPRNHTSPILRRHPRNVKDNSRPRAAPSTPGTTRELHKPVPGDVHRNLDDILSLSSSSTKAKWSRGGRGWRSRPAVHADSGLST